MLKTMSTWAVSLAAVIATVVVGKDVWARRHLYISPPPAPVPHTIRLDAIWYGDSEQPIVRWKEIHAMRADGSTVQIVYGQKSIGAFNNRDVRFADGSRWTVDDVRQTLVVDAVAESARAVRRDPRSDCATTIDGASPSSTDQLVRLSRVAGYEVAEIRMRLSTTSFAKDLSCATVFAVGNEMPGGHMEKVATAIEQGEPDGSLFVVGASYRRLGPLEAAERY